jgi:hypothetical protein
LPIHTFIYEAEKRVADVSRKQHLALYLFKKRLLRVLPNKVINHPECALFYERIVVEMHLHMFMAEEYIGVARQLPSVIAYLKECSVAEKHQTEKTQLIGYAEQLLMKVKRLLTEQ